MKARKSASFPEPSIPQSKANTVEDEEKLPYFVFLGGGPGFEFKTQRNAGHIAETLWMDPRGTGLSTHISQESFPPHLVTDQEKANYLKHFRADSIVKDCEELRKILLGDKQNAEDRKWTIMGSSYGGFCAITYLSFFPSGLKEVFLSGGLPPLTGHPERVYRSLIPMLKKRNQMYYEKYPLDVKRVRDIVAYLEENSVLLPTGGTLSIRRFQSIGIGLGVDGGIDRIHQLVFRMASDLQLIGKMTFKTLQLAEESGFHIDGNPLFCILHEQMYCQGYFSDTFSYRKYSITAPDTLRNGLGPAQWRKIPNSHGSTSKAYPILKHFSSAEKLYVSSIILYAVFDDFFNEVFPEFLDDFINLRPLKGVAHLLADDESWDALYDIEKLRKNEVKVSAVTYFNDMYVDFAIAQETASTIKNCEQYITNQLFHDGLYVDGKDVMKRLFQISKRVY
ncbi:Alpha beta-hydrolase [Mycena venus]|uniref:Alpha beta-hydrolase n=1 Tax=Mycena venus TaxID=2733690 RepID=A0A8H6YNM9_9AGAR|nr:Alpha beta-hydrolase [Mycena venus]